MTVCSVFVNEGLEEKLTWRCLVFALDLLINVNSFL